MWGSQTSKKETVDLFTAESHHGILDADDNWQPTKTLTLYDVIWKVAGANSIEKLANKLKSKVGSD